MPIGLSTRLAGAELLAWISKRLPVLVRMTVAAMAAAAAAAAAVAEATEALEFTPAPICLCAFCYRCCSFSLFVSFLV